MAKDRLSKEKLKWSRDNLVENIKSHLEYMQQQLFKAAKKRRKENSIQIDNYQDFKKAFAGQKSQFVYAHWDGSQETEAQIKEETKATIRCIPADAIEEKGDCIVSGRPSFQRVLFAKAY